MAERPIKPAPRADCHHEWHFTVVIPMGQSSYDPDLGASSYDPDPSDYFLGDICALCGQRRAHKFDPIKGSKK